MVNKRGKKWFNVSGIDLVLLGIAAALFAVGTILLRVSPRWWGYYLTALDVRMWPLWKSIGLVAVLLDSLLIVWCWPTPQQDPPAETVPGQKGTS